MQRWQKRRSWQPPLLRCGKVSSTVPRVTRSHSLSIRLGKLLRRWGITDRRLVAAHSCRHHYAAALTDADVPDRAIKQLMGHAPVMPPMSCRNAQSLTRRSNQKEARKPERMQSNNQPRQPEDPVRHCQNG